jgi:aminoglycoside phosphotransferase (APT) family kinase protein
MDSLTKNRQSTDAVLRIAADAFGAVAAPVDPESVRELTHGWFSATYHVRLQDGSSVVLKVAPSPATAVLTYERQMMRNELAAMRLIRRLSSVPVPEVLHADDSLRLCDAPWFFMSFLGGDNLGELWDANALSTRTRAAFGQSIGVLNRRLNSVIGPGFGPITGPFHPTWSGAVTKRTHDILKDAARANVSLGSLSQRLLSAVSRSRSILDEVRVPHFVEWDLWPSNVIVDGGEIVGVIDHERALFGDPLMEAGFLGLDLPMLGDPTAFMQGYGVVELDASARRRRRLYTALLLLVMIIEPRFRGPQDPAQAGWALERLDDVLTDLEH